MPTDELIQGKSGEHGFHLPLWLHLKDTAFIMNYLCLERVPKSVKKACGLDDEAFRNISCFLAAVHDIGKCTPLFASRILERLPFQREQLCQTDLHLPSSFSLADRCPHALMGEAIVRSYGCPVGLSSIIGAHHGRPTQVEDQIDEHCVVYPQNYFSDQPERWKEMQRIFFYRALHDSGYRDTVELPRLSNCAQMLLCGLLIQADWIASNQYYFPLLPPEENGLTCNYEKRSQNALHSLALPSCWQSKTPEVNDTFYLFRFGFTPNMMQRLVAEIADQTKKPGLMMIEAQMGLGKTEAALAAAEIFSAKTGCGGIYFGLPTQATSNGIFPRLAQWAKNISDKTQTIRLVHSLAELNEDYTSLFHEHMLCQPEENLIAHKWFSGKKQALLADFVVGTIDTVLLAALRQKHLMLKHLGLSSKTIIIDECHAYDAYMSTYLERLLIWLGAYRVPVVLLSATMPQSRKEAMFRAYLNTKNLTFQQSTGYPLITWTDDDTIRTQAIDDLSSPVCIKIETIAENEFLNVLHRKNLQGGCIGIIVNTVHRAQYTYKQLKNEFPDWQVLLYHAQFIAAERIQREKQLLELIGKKSVFEKRDHVLIVGTQVLEQSLDIDFDYLITDLCPMDLLLQRMGRLHRHTRKRPEALLEPNCAVITAGNEILDAAVRVYDEWLLKCTREKIPHEVMIPTDIPFLVNRVYEASDISDQLYQKYQNKLALKESKAANWLISKPKYSKRETLNSLHGMLNMDLITSNEQQIQAKVRDTLPSLDVLVMRRLRDGYIGFMPWISKKILRADTIPSEAEGKQIALQRLHLPLAFSIGEKSEETVANLEKENRDHLPAWQESSWLDGELILLMNENCERELNGYLIRYDRDLGFCYEREEQ